eukprot:CAMPEP_0172775976 /NCGR_PEP_ID=MMETSP1074-20121228/199019_1 /TAXON_ID=2916 /ORGANISM="Ceratium fusus, Strain PA161109" /LENGTH=45 /DNA_ID= /DNA_START= /DNA_END= /DNA_ORIENTATION=
MIEVDKFLKFGPLKVGVLVATCIAKRQLQVNRISKSTEKVTPAKS